MGAPGRVARACCHARGAPMPVSRPVCVRELVWVSGGAGDGVDPGFASRRVGKTATGAGPKEPAPAAGPKGLAAPQNRSCVRCVATVGKVPWCGSLRQGAKVCGPGLGVAQSVSTPGRTNGDSVRQWSWGECKCEVCNVGGRAALFLVSLPCPVSICVCPMAHRRHPRRSSRPIESCSELATPGSR